jgi:hypothetical protein
VDNSVCQIAGWTCNPRRYNSGVNGQCDCGCGIVDPDCASSLSTACASCAEEGSCGHAGSCPSNIHPTSNGQCTPDGMWTCSPTWYGDTQCDCGCGIVDIDCTDATLGSCAYCSLGCSGYACAQSNIDTNDNSQCTVPAGWTCLAEFYADGATCHCGCGAVDFDCADATVAACEACVFPPGGGCSPQGICSASNFNPTDNALCL